MELTMTRLLLLTIVGAILPVSMVSANPAWGPRANTRRDDLKAALDYLKKHRSENGDNLAAGSRRMQTGGFPARQMGGFGPAAAGAGPLYDQRFNFGNQRETPEIEPIKVLMNEQMASDGELSELESVAGPDDMGIEDSISSESEFVNDILADIIAKGILENMQLDTVPAKDDEPLNTLEDVYVLDGSPSISFDYDEENQNYGNLLAPRMENQDDTPIDNNIAEDEIDQDLLDELMMTYLTETEYGREQKRNKIQEERAEEPILTEEDLFVAETILREIEDELEQEKIKQEDIEKKKALKAAPQAAATSCPVLDFLVDDCEIATIDGIGGDGYKQAFRMPCNWHQICYTCGYGYEISQDICDEAFYLEMLARCGTSQSCINRADFFLLAVTDDRVPVVNTPSVCQRKCVKDFLLGLDE